jgi:hypothetical protein
LTIRMRCLFVGLSYLVVLLIILTVGACVTIDKTSGGLSESQNEALLKDRATEFLKAQAAGDRAKMYDIYDPFFRARAKKGIFTDTTIPIYYYNPAVLSVDIKGNVATVKAKIEYEVKNLVNPKSGKKFNQPKTESIMTDTWLFIDGTWYKQYVDHLSDATFANY